MLRSLAVFAASALLFACSGPTVYEGSLGGTSGGGPGASAGPGGSSADPGADGEAVPDPALDDETEDEVAGPDDSTGPAELQIGVEPEPKQLLDVAFDEIGSQSSALTSECPDERDLPRYAGPASWLKKYGVDGVCVASRYACRMPTTDSDFRRYENPKDSADGAWPVALGIPMVDGRGNEIGTTTVNAAKLNWGQRKSLHRREYVYAFAVGGVSGWVPASCIGWDGTTVPSASCTGKSGGTPSDFPVFGGRKPGKKYDAIKKLWILSNDEIIQAYPWLANIDPDQLKITCNAPNEPHRSIADYIGRLSSDGSFYTINLLANVPGVSPALGGIASDTLRVAHLVGNVMTSDQLTFHRLVHVNSVEVYLFKPESTQGAPVDGTSVQFFYGYVTYPSGSGWRRRYGWLPDVVLRAQ